MGAEPLYLISSPETRIPGTQSVGGGGGRPLMAEVLK